MSLRVGVETKLCLNLVWEHSNLFNSSENIHEVRSLINRLVVGYVVSCVLLEVIYTSTQFKTCLQSFKLLGSAIVR